MKGSLGFVVLKCLTFFESKRHIFWKKNIWSSPAPIGLFYPLPQEAYDNRANFTRESGILAGSVVITKTVKNR